MHAHAKEVVGDLIHKSTFHHVLVNRISDVMEVEIVLRLGDLVNQGRVPEI